ncbi:MAG: hypothetical protein QNL39_14745 [Akkermansiaceae bacterium]
MNTLFSTKQVWKFIGLAVLVFCHTVHGQQTENEELFSEAKEQIRLRKYENAIHVLGEVLHKSGASLGDDTVTASKKLYVDTVIVMAENLARKDLTLESAELLILHSNLPILSDQGTLLKERAGTVFNDALRSATKKSESQRIVELTKSWAGLFPDKEALVTEAELMQHRINAVAQTSKTGNPRVAFLEYRNLRKEGVSEGILRKSGLSEGSLTLRYAKALYKREWYRQSASLLREQLRSGTLSGDEKSEAERIEEQSLLNHAAACMKFGNLKMCREAYDVYMSGDRPARERIRAQNMKLAVDRIGTAGEPKELKFPDKFVEGKGVWKDAGHGYFISSSVQTGNCAKSRGGEWKTADIEVAAGTVIEGGTLRASHGKLAFLGTAKKPIVLRNVHLECDYTAAVHATNTLFVDCTFKKTGSWHWNNGFSSKWIFTDCMLVKSNFVGLTRGDYGIRWHQTIFFRCKLPQRNLNSKADRDATGEYHGHWNTITDCLFMECELPPSMVWGCVLTRLIDNEVAGTSDFYSAKPLKVGMSATPPEFVRTLKTATLNKGHGSVEYIPLRRASQPPFRGHWNLLKELEE